MSNEKSSSKSAGAGLLVAITASLCCITPVLALISGASGIAASFSWLEPFRPYLIGITVLVLGFAWYQKLKPKPADMDCACEPGEEEKTPFMQSKLFLGMVTVFAMVMLAFPYYSSIFYPDVQKDNLAVSQSTVHEISLAIDGMTCTSCEEHIDHAAMEVAGVLTANSDFKTGEAIVKYDESTSSRQEVIDAINATGYKVVSVIEKKGQDKPSLAITTANLQEVVLPVAGMTCTSCEEHINYEVNKLAGVAETKASYKAGEATVKYDPAKTSKEEIIKAINDTGYKVKEATTNSAGK